MAGRFKVTVRLEFFCETAAQMPIQWKRDVTRVDETSWRAVIFVEKPDITRASLEWKAAKTQQAWDRARARAAAALGADSGASGEGGDGDRGNGGFSDDGDGDDDSK